MQVKMSPYDQMTPPSPDTQISPGLQRTESPAEGEARARAAQSIRNLLEWVGEDPRRDGLRDTPERVLRAFQEYFGGYAIDPKVFLNTTFSEVEAYTGIISLHDISFVSHCEHHMAPFTGKAHVAYLPKETVVGISKLARLVDAFARRLQIQERLTAQIATTLFQTLKPHGVAVMVEATHSCMTARGVGKPGSSLKTSQFLGAFEHDEELRRQFEHRVAGASS